MSLLILVVLLSSLLPFAEVVTLDVFNKEMRHLSILLVLFFSLFLLDILPAPVNKTGGRLKLVQDGDYRDCAEKPNKVELLWPLSVLCILKEFRYTN
jgi:hypothetical protein